MVYFPVMNHYESLIILNPKTTEEKVQALMDKFAAKIENAKGIVDKVESWGKRRFAYTLQSAKTTKEGLYFLIKFQGPSKAPQELQTQLHLTEDVMRYVVVRSTPLAPIPEEPAAPAAPAAAEPAPTHG